MKAKLKYTFIDPDINATTEALLAVCMESVSKKARNALCAAAAEDKSQQEPERIGNKLKE